MTRVKHTCKTGTLYERAVKRHLFLYFRSVCVLRCALPKNSPHIGWFPTKKNYISGEIKYIDPAVFFHHYLFTEIALKLFLLPSLTFPEIAPECFFHPLSLYFQLFLTKKRVTNPYSPGSNLDARI